MNSEKLWENRGENRGEMMERYNVSIGKTKWKLFSLIGYEQTWDLFFNQAYFTNGQKINHNTIHKIIEKANTMSNKLREIKNELEKETILNQTQKDLLKKRLNGIIMWNEYHKKAIYIEAEKAWFPLSNGDRIRCRKKIEEIEQQLYGDSISNLPERKQKVIDKLHELYESKSQLLSDEEKAFRKNKIINTYSNKNIIKTKETPNEKEDIFIKEESIFDIITLLLEIEWFNKDKITKIQMSDWIEWIEKQDNNIYLVSTKLKEKDIDDYFNKIGDANNLKIVKKVKGNNSVSITKEETLDNGEIKFKKNHIYIWAAIKGKYSLKKKVLPIMFDHETSTHVKTAMGDIHNANIKGSNRDVLEEWIALLNQKMAEWGDLEWLYEASIADIRMFLAEQFNDDDLRKWLTIYYKLMKTKDPDIEWWIRRVRMGVPIWEKWSRKSDLKYWNSKGIIKDLEELSKTEEWIKILNKYAKVIYSTKIWYEWLENINEILQWIKDVNDLEPEFPIFAGKILYRKLFKGKLDKDKMLESDVRGIIETNKNVTLEQKKLLIKIIHIMKENEVK